MNDVTTNEIIDKNYRIKCTKKSQKSSIASNG